MNKEEEMTENLLIGDEASGIKGQPDPGGNQNEFVSPLKLKMENYADEKTRQYVSPDLVAAD